MTIEEAIRILGVDPNNTTSEELDVIVENLRQRFEERLHLMNPQAVMDRVYEAADVVRPFLPSSIQRTEERTEEREEDNPIDEQTLSIEDRLLELRRNLLHIYSQEREEAYQNGPFNAEEYEKFTEKYRKLKEEANQELEQLNRQYKEEKEKEAKRIKEVLASIVDKDAPIRDIENKLAESKKRFVYIFAQEREEAYQNGPFTAEEYEKFTEKYRKLKEEANQELEQLNKQYKEAKEGRLGLPGSVSGETMGLPGPTIGEIPGLPGPVLKEEEDSIETEKDKIRTLHTILAEIEDGLMIDKKKDHKVLRASNIQVADSFKKEMSSGNYLYNIVHLVPTLIIKVPIQLLTKLKNKIMSSQETKERIATMKERIENLKEEDLQLIYDEYRADETIQDDIPVVVNDLLKSRISRWVGEKTQELSEMTERMMLNVMGSYQEVQEIDKMLKTDNLSDDVKEMLEYRRQEMIRGKDEMIDTIRRNQKTERQWYSGGLHGMEEDMKARESKQSKVGYRFAKESRIHNVELDKEIAQCERDEKYAILQGDAEGAMNAFMNREMLLSKNTKIEDSVFGKRSVGDKYYSPLPSMPNYNNDPFVRDLFTSMALVGAVASAANGIITHQVESKKILENQNDDTMKEVHQLGNELKGQSDTFAKGIKQQTQQSVHDATGTIERTTLDKNNWNFTDQYHVDDSLGHQAYNELYQNTEGAFTKIASDYTSGALSSKEALDAISDVAANTQQHLNAVYGACRPIMQEYAKTHPQFDLEGALSSMDSLIQNPEAIINMNEAMQRSVDIGEQIANLTANQADVIATLPSDLSTTLIGSLTSAALASNVANSMNYSKRKSSYGNSVTDMVEDFVSQQAEEQVEKTSKK